MRKLLVWLALIVYTDALCIDDTFIQYATSWGIDIDISFVPGSITRPHAPKGLGKNATEEEIAAYASAMEIYKEELKDAKRPMMFSINVTPSCSFTLNDTVLSPGNFTLPHHPILSTYLTIPVLHSRQINGAWTFHAGYK